MTFILIDENKHSNGGRYDHVGFLKYQNSTGAVAIRQPILYLWIKCRNMLDNAQNTNEKPRNILHTKRMTVMRRLPMRLPLKGAEQFR